MIDYQSLNILASIANDFEKKLCIIDILIRTA